MRPTNVKSIRAASGVVVLVSALGALAPGCATTNPGEKSQALEESRADVVRRYEVERARLAARQEREHSRMEIRHEAEAARLDKELVSILNDSGEDLRQVQARIVAERRIFRADSLARLQKIDSRVEEIVERSRGGLELLIALEELGAQRAAIQEGLEALDLVSDEVWFDARRTVSNQIGVLARGVEALDRAEL
jgi:hypothetical protein